MLSFIMGLSWVLEVVSWAAGATGAGGAGGAAVWSIFDLINALQGVVIFAIFVLQQPVRSFVKVSFDVNFKERWPNNSSLRNNIVNLLRKFEVKSCDM